MNKYSFQCNISISPFGSNSLTASLYKLVTLGRITKTKLSKYVGLSQFKWDLEKKCVQKAP